MAHSRATGNPLKTPTATAIWWGVCILILLAAFVRLGRVEQTVLAWGPSSHRLINSWAIQTLPPEIHGYFEANRQYLIDHANDPDEWMKKDRYERLRHYIYLDKYGLFPYPNLPRTYQRAVEQYGAGRISRDGVLPWQIGEYSLRLTKAMRAGNWDEVKEDAAVLGHYVGDAHDPMHTTQNYDGQLTGQSGLEMRFGTQLVERYSTFFMVRPDPAAKIDDPTEYAFMTVLEANSWVDRLLLMDRRSMEGLSEYNGEYFDRFYSRVGSIAMQEISGAAHDTGSYWYTAWLNAGKPQLPSR
jgi:hypothetical protein